MKPKSFPARKLIRQLKAPRNMSKPWTEDELNQISAARQIRTKKDRRNAA